MWAGQNTETSRKCLRFVGCVWTVVSLLFLFCFVFVSLVWTRPKAGSLHSHTQLSDERDCRAMGSGCPRTAEARNQPQASPCGICGGQSDTGIGFSPGTSFSTVTIMSPRVPFSFIHHRRCLPSAINAYTL